MPVSKGRILFVAEDEALVRLGQGMLARLGYDVLLRPRGLEAYRWLAAAPAPVDCVLTDHLLADMSGTQVAAACHHLWPTLPVIMCSGASRTFWAPHEVGLGLAAVLRKPLTLPELAQTLMQVLGARHAPTSAREAALQ
jgi:DNA-binding NtrC family response regulator